MAAPLIFLGPSLSRDEAETLCAGEYHPPIGRGDLGRLCGTTPRVVLIIDGRFRESRAVSPKEVLAALDAGHAVVGASSMGALRAVELERFGMRGIGRVFEAFRSGSLDADDEVANVYDPATFVATSEPLFNMRTAFTEACANALVTVEERDRLVSIAAGLYYADRTYRRVVTEGGLSPEHRLALTDFCEHRATDVKAEDAREALRFIAGSKLDSVAPVDGDLPRRPHAPRPGPAVAGLPPAVKVGAWDSVRAVIPAETERRLARVRAVVGITRVANVEGLDCLQIPNYVAIRPSRDGHCNSTYSGKALRGEDARIGAQMEALEMACALDDRVERVTASFEDLVASGRSAVDPDSLIPYADAPTDLRSRALDWVAGWQLHGGAEVLVPADAVFFRRDLGPTVWKYSSNGVATGNSLAEALAHGLAEVIERDAETMFRIATEYARFPWLLAAVAGPRRVAEPPAALPEPRYFPLVRLASLPQPLAEIVERINERGVRVMVRVITSDVAVPTVLCALWEPTYDTVRHLVQYGCGTHPDPVIALRRAITEAAQSRCTAIQGSREDLQAPAMATADPPSSDFDGAPDGIDFAELPRAVNADVRDDIHYMLRALDAAGLPSPIAVDISHPSLDFPVVKMVVPGLELALHDVHANRVPLGWRSRRYFREAYEAVEARRASTIG